MSQNNYLFCPYCASRLETREGYGHRRPTCPHCGFIHFRDPKVAVIGFVTQGKRVLLVQRAMDPEKGKWALPGGFMDAGEMPEEALRRELREEVSLEVDIGELLTILPMAGAADTRQGIVLVFQAVPMGTVPETLPCADDVAAADWFAPGDFPQNLAFESTKMLLRSFSS